MTENFNNKSFMTFILQSHKLVSRLMFTIKKLTDEKHQTLLNFVLSNLASLVNNIQEQFFEFIEFSNYTRSFS